MAGSSTAVALQDEKPQGPFTGSHMLNVKNARLRSEHDVTLLRNRLERLRQEERKALKKIEETRRRADQIVSLKTRNEENHMRKALEADYSKKQLERARQRLQGHKDMQQEAIRETAAMVAAQKKQEADMLRQQRQLIQEHVNEQKSKHVARAQQINTMIKQQAAQQQQQKMQSRMLHEEALQAEMEDRMLIEERRRNAADVLVSEMEDQEEIAIERLRRTQEAQKNAYEELERALSNPPPPLDQRRAALGDYSTGPDPDDGY
uniref:Uncharacterized protein n=1 Tax=Haptolina ericina TaxID=156174 RepID=A0A7S3F0P6_9EUKA|mmetsp:Transcript_39112/g.88841  ORF Transcript_39112/g.88841 Transcript_39112/m.88841 type:complete len:263 (+) Transcript_39112:28-816(+)